MSNLLNSILVKAGFVDFQSLKDHIILIGCNKLIMYFSSFFREPVIGRIVMVTPYKVN